MDGGLGTQLPHGVSGVPGSASRPHVHDLYKYTRCFDVREEDGKWFNCYLVYKDTSKMDTKEFSHLIDGAIDEAKALGIETDTPEQLARYKEEWSR